MSIKITITPQTQGYERRVEARLFVSLDETHIVETEDEAIALAIEKLTELQVKLAAEAKRWARKRGERE